MEADKPIADAVPNADRPFDRIVGLFKIDPKVATEFFVMFARLEYALKAQEHIVKTAQKQDLTIDWRKLSQLIDGRFQKKVATDEELKRAVEYFCDCPPQKQIWNGHNKDFELPAPQNVPQTERVLLCLRTLRNNLFHGGKDFKREDADRDQTLIAHGLAVITAVVDCNEDLRADFLEEQ